MELLDPDDEPVPDVSGLSASPETFRFSCHGDCDPASTSACSISLAVVSMTNSSGRELSYRMTFAGVMRSGAGKERQRKLGQVFAWDVHSEQGGLFSSGGSFKKTIGVRGPRSVLTVQTHYRTRRLQDATVIAEGSSRPSDPTPI
jgi:hypothetical protein